MKKSILRFGALALMSWMSIGAFAGEGDTFTANGDKYQITTEDPSVDNAKTSGEVMLVSYGGTSTSFGTEAIKDSYGHEYFCTAIKGEVSDKDHGAFNGKALTSSISLGSHIKTIGKQAFSWLTTVGTIDVTELTGVKTIGEDAFAPYTVYTYDWGTITDRDSSRPITLTGGAQFVLDLSKVNQLGNYAFYAVNFPVGSTVKLGTISVIPSNLFESAQNLKTVELDPKSTLTTVGNGAFAYCKSIEHFGYYDAGKYYLPATLTTIGSSSFEYAFNPDATSVDFRFPVVSQGKITKVGSYAFYGCGWLTNAEFCNLFPADPISGGVKLKKELNYESSAFPCCGLTGKFDFTALDDMTYFNDAFNSNRITEVVLPKSITTIGWNAFIYCDALQKCNLTDTKVTSIEGYAFNGTRSYLDVKIPSTVTSIGNNAFGGSLSNDRTITIVAKEISDPYAKSAVIESYSWYWDGKKNVYYSNSPLGSAGEKTTLVVPMGLMKAYATITDKEHGYNWSNANIIKVARPAIESTETFYNGAFKYEVAPWSNEYSTEATFTEAPQAVIAGVCQWTQYKGADNKDNKNTDFNNDGKHKGAKYTALFSGNELNLPQTVVKEGENNKDFYAYYEVAGVKVTPVMDEEEEITGYTTAFDFSGVPANAKSSDKYVLKEKIQTVNIQADKLDLANVFTNFKALETVNLCAIETDNTTGWCGASANVPAIVKLGDNAFKSCGKLAAFNNAKTKYDDVIGASAFEGTAISKFTISDNVTTLSDKAFFNTKLTSINIPKSVASIGQNVFDGKAVNGAFVGVSDVTVNWTDDEITVNENSFGDAVWHWRGTKQEYIPRKLYIPSGFDGYYAEVGDGLFNDSHKFTRGEAIEIKSGLYTGRLDVQIDIDNDDATRILAFTDDNTISHLKVNTADPKMLVHYTRKVSNPTNLQAWFVPFTLQDIDKQGAKFYRIYDTAVGDNDGTPVTTLELVEEKGDVKANTPYIFIPGAEEITFNAVGIKKTFDDGARDSKGKLINPINKVVVADIDTEYTIEGTYDDVKSGNNGKGAPTNPFYALKSNAFHPALADATLHACRIFMKTKGLANPYAVKLVVLDDEEATGIKDINAQSLNAPMFDLMGRQIAAPAKGQVYIQNGVKKLAK